MLICIAPDQEGRFGFNVKVGLSLTVLVLFLPSTHKAKFSGFFFSHALCLSPLCNCSL